MFEVFIRMLSKDSSRNKVKMSVIEEYMEPQPEVPAVKPKETQNVDDDIEVKRES